LEKDIGYRIWNCVFYFHHDNEQALEMSAAHACHFGEIIRQLDHWVAVLSSSLREERLFSTGQAWMSGARKKSAFTGGMNTTGFSFSSKDTIQPRQYMDDIQVNWQSMIARADRGLMQEGEIGGMLQALTGSSNVEEFGRSDAFNPIETGMDDSNQTPMEVRHDGLPHDPVIFSPWSDISTLSLSSFASAVYCSILVAKL
jgi:hypothetical protein